MLFTDDAVLVSEIGEGLQSSLDNLHEYCIKWNLNINIEKKNVVFRKGGTLEQHDNWYYAGQEIEIVDPFSYLGVVFLVVGYSCKMLNICQKRL